MGSQSESEQENLQSKDLSSAHTRVVGQDDPVDPSTVADEPFLCHFLDQTEAASKARTTYIKILIQRTCLIIAAMFVVFSIYWGAVAKIPARSLGGWIVDFDGDRIGKAVVTQLSAFESPAVSWRVRSAKDFPNGASSLADAVVQERCWVAVAINVGATSRLNATFRGEGGLAYDAATAITTFAVEARNENAFRSLIRPNVELWLQQIKQDLAVQLLTELMSSSNTTLTVLSPKLLVEPVSYKFENLRPFDVPVATAVTFVGLIYLLILSFFVVNSAILARTASGLERRLTLGSLIKVRLLTSCLIYLIITCFYSLLTLAFQLPFGRRFGHAGFIIFWMLSWLGMTAAGIALESMITLLTVRYIQVFLILWIIGNVAVCLWPIDALPTIYRYGRGAPFYQISRGVRTIVFSTKDELGLNFGILLVWIAISCITLPAFQWYRRREELMALRKQQQQKMDRS